MHLSCLTDAQFGCIENILKWWLIADEYSSPRDKLCFKTYEFETAGLPKKIQEKETYSEHYI